METEIVEVVRFVEPVDFNVELQHAVIKTVVVAFVAVTATAIAETVGTRIAERIKNRKQRKIEAVTTEL